MEAYRRCLDSNLHETPFEGDLFTWSKSRKALHTIKERLDWCFVNNHWENYFNTPQVHHLDYYQSDHRAITAAFNLLSAQTCKAKRRSHFRFEKMWLADPEYKDIIVDHWLNSITSDPITVVSNNLKSCAENLQSWHERKYGSMKKNIKECQKKVETLNNSYINSSSHLDELKQAETILDELLEQEETYWQQCSRVDWLACGDRNTKFFHAKANARKSNNRINFLIDDMGLKVKSNAKISLVIQDYYAELFSSW
ncbi:hypothetical protein CsatA_004434 [Cannabis sativa]